MAKKKVQEPETPERTTSITVGTLIGYVERTGRVRLPDKVETTQDVFISLGNAYVYTLTSAWDHDHLDFHIGDTVRIKQVFEDDGNGTMALTSTVMESIHA
jgi:hypothetical protein